MTTISIAKLTEKSGSCLSSMWIKLLHCKYMGSDTFPPQIAFPNIPPLLEIPCKIYFHATVKV